MARLARCPATGGAAPEAEGGTKASEMADNQVLHAAGSGEAGAAEEEDVMAKKLTTLERLTAHIESRLKYGGHVTQTAAGALANLISLLAADDEGREILAVYLRVHGYEVTPESERPEHGAPKRARRKGGK